VKLESAILTFAANGLWQGLVLAAGVQACRPLIGRSSPQLQCRFWGAALLAGVALPAASASSVVLGRESALRVLQVRPDTLLIWTVLFGFLFVISTFATLRRWLATRQVLHATPDSGERIRIVTARCARALGIAPVPVRISRSLASPVTLGARRPVIVLPEQLAAGASIDLLQTALGHELAHIRRRDFAWSILLEVVVVPLAWHPVMGWFKRELAAARELACDDLVAGHVVDPRVYAESLLSLAQIAINGRAPKGALGVLDGDNLEARIERLLCRPSSVRRSWWTVCAFLVLVATAIGCQRASLLIDRCYLHPRQASARAIDLCVRFPSFPLG
jgi:beta-lactamase regulating signal transducer with metallopeptidase domain